MSEDYDKKKMSKEIRRQKELGKERVETTKKIIKNLKEHKKIEEGQLNIIDEHQRYWEKELENTNEEDRERYQELKNKLKQEKRIRNKVMENIKHLDKEIKFQEEHAR